MSDRDRPDRAPPDREDSGPLPPEAGPTHDPAAEPEAAERPVSWRGGGRPPPPPPGSRQPMFNVPPVTLTAVLVLAAVFGLLQVGGERLEWWVLLNGSVNPARLAAALRDPLSLEMLVALVPLLAHALIHFDSLHFLANGGFLLAFGSACERAMGRRRYLWLLLLSALGGAVAQVAADWGQLQFMYGASGAVSGCIGGVIRLMMAQGDPQRRRFAVNMMLILLAMNLAIGLFGPRLIDLDASIAWQAHIGGFVAGFLVARPRLVRL